MSSDIIDQIGVLLSAASTATDVAARATYLAEARVRLTLVKSRVENFAISLTALEDELVRLAKAAA